MDCKKLANLLIPDDDLLDPEEYEGIYPERNLPRGAEVTRLAPSPTGFIHLGNLYSALADERAAHTSGGVFYLRIEDTDEKRKVEGAVESVISSLSYFGLRFDEGAEVAGENCYGPYWQRQRAKMYRSFAKKLIEEGLAYPCFCTEEDLSKMRWRQQKEKLTPGYYGKWARCRDLSMEEIEKNLAEGKSFVVRLRSRGDGVTKHAFKDVIKGEITYTENDQDVVILKADGIPTYHFAHVLDDHFMRTTLVIRGEEWLSSLPIHLELYEDLGFKPPRYAHTASLMKIDGGGKRKLSKRKDPELALEFYKKEGYHPRAVMKYLMTILNSGFEDWSRKNPEKDYTEYPFKVEKMGRSGALFDIDKLRDISKDEISALSSEEAYDFIKEWAASYGSDADRAHIEDRETTLKILDLLMGAGLKKKRKDIDRASAYFSLSDYFFDDTFDLVDEISCDRAAAKRLIEGFSSRYDAEDDGNAWFLKVKEAADEAGFCSDNAEYKANPEKYFGNVSDAATVLRIAVTGRANSPDLCSIMKILGKKRSLERLSAAAKRL